MSHAPGTTLSFVVVLLQHKECTLILNTKCFVTLMQSPE